MRFLKIGDASKELGICINTLRKWVDLNQIPHKMSPGGQRLIDVESYLEGKSRIDQKEPDSKRKKSVFYCRVSTKKQEKDLERQIKLAKEKYPEHEIIKDIGSGINWKRRGLKSILEKSYSGELKEVVVFHRDRLARFGFELIEFILGIQGTKLVVLDKQDETSKHESSEQELAEDIMAIITVFSNRQMGKRRYRKLPIEENTDSSDRRTEVSNSELDE